MCVGTERNDGADDEAECGASPLLRDGVDSPLSSSTDGSEGRGSSSAHLLDSYLERMYDSIL